MTITPSCTEKALAFLPIFQPSSVLPSNRPTKPSSVSGALAAKAAAKGSSNAAAASRDVVFSLVSSMNIVFMAILLKHSRRGGGLSPPKQWFNSPRPEAFHRRIYDQRPKGHQSVMFESFCVNRGLLGHEVAPRTIAGLSQHLVPGCSPGRIDRRSQPSCRSYYPSRCPVRKDGDDRI